MRVPAAETPGKTKTILELSSQAVQQEGHIPPQDLIPVLSGPLSRYAHMCMETRRLVSLEGKARVTGRSAMVVAPHDRNCLALIDYCGDDLFERRAETIEV